MVVYRNNQAIVLLATSLLLASNKASAFVASPPSLSGYPSSVVTSHFSDNRPANVASSRDGSVWSKSRLGGSLLSKTSLNFFFADDDNNNNEINRAATPPPPRPKPVVIEPDFRVAALFSTLGVFLDTVPYIQLTLGPLVTALGVLFLVQTLRLRFVFDETYFELSTVADIVTGELEEVGENFIVGGENRWATKSIFNYDFFPEGWIDGPVGPILVYFKENQTPSESWDQGPGKMANDPEKIKAGIARPGQVHFFPAVANAQQLQEEFAKRGCKKI